MIPLSITPNLEAAPWTDLQDLTELAAIERIGRLPRGTTSGNSTVTVVIRMADGRRFAAQTTLALMNGAMSAINAVEQQER